MIVRKPPPSYITFLDGIRAIAVLMVMVHHWNSNWLPNGWLGVDLFFTLSGYLITRNILLKEEGQSFLIWQYLKKRMLRIWPAYFLVLFTDYLLLFIFKKSVFWGALPEIINYLTFTTRFFWQYINIPQIQTDASWFSYALAVLWSIRVEEWFYLTWPPLLLWLIRKQTRIKWFFFLLIFFYPLYIRVAVLQGSRSAYMFTFTRFDSLYIGCLLALLEIKRKKIFDSMTKQSHVLFALSIGIIVFSLLKFQKGDYLTNTLGYPLVALGTAGLIWAGQATNKFSAHFVKLLSIPLLINIGKISYELYLIHGMVLDFYPIRYRSFGIFFLLCLMVAVPLHFIVVKRFMALADQTRSRQ